MARLRSTFCLEKQAGDALAGTTKVNQAFIGLGDAKSSDEFTPTNETFMDATLPVLMSRTRVRLMARSLAAVKAVLLRRLPLPAQFPQRVAVNSASYNSVRLLLAHSMRT